MKKYIFKAAFVLSMALSLVSCQDWITAPSPAVTKLSDFSPPEVPPFRQLMGPMCH